MSAWRALFLSPKEPLLQMSRLSEAQGAEVPELSSWWKAVQVLTVCLTPESLSGTAKPPDHGVAICSSSETLGPSARSL